VFHGVSSCSTRLVSKLVSAKLLLAAFAVGGVVLVRTSYEQATFAVGDNEESARLILEGRA
jgi:ribose/xylose/arabinose/galactoside ABC-type transport system permease subunit